jgi:hypothetical protein
MPLREDDEEINWTIPNWGKYQPPWEYDMNSFGDYKK